MLLGEYTVLMGSRGLALPFHGRCARWAWGTGPDERLEPFADYVAALGNTNYAVAQFKQDIQAGLCLESNIPTGYGMGSSGSLCAAFYERYALQKASSQPELLQALQELEGYFHGSSSGLDPLVSYLDAAVLLEAGGPKIVSLPEPGPVTQQLFLHDTGMGRQTSVLVQQFKKRLVEDPDFNAAMHEHLTPWTEKGIDAFLSGDALAFKTAFQHISSLQYTWLEVLIPEQLKENWQKGLEGKGPLYKICGAGGGGFMLGLNLGGYTLDQQETVYFNF